ncbi:regulatory signaling modulator protein AmpE [Pleionea sp. CnH1-48]|uniref:regulatory signaling modulator protein AmpE n=1 Tax=Pleionea sp. CnH1-48 TaxID=2954494 RepID=UPI0020983B09|nr:regulatory signaling modulator protein AmpE [Pleionea sp. CnH1-48]MCO7223968.1 regulatory signaling modulator protein AmpE [Pleionea sp. CnH1-48]
MTLLVLVIVLVVEYYWSPLTHYRQHSWISRYANEFSAKLTKTFDVPAYFVVAIVLASPLFLVWLLLDNHHSLLSSLFELLIEIVLLSWCLGPTALFNRSKYGEVLENNANFFGGQIEQNDNSSLLLYGHVGYIAPIFWFLLAGPVAVLAYRLMSVVALTEKPMIESAQISWWQKLFHIADWLPGRLTTLLFLLAGNFIAGFSVYSKKALDASIKSCELIIDVGQQVLPNAQDDSSSLTEVSALIERSLILLMTFVALSSLFS